MDLTKEMQKKLTQTLKDSLDPMKEELKDHVENYTADLITEKMAKMKTQRNLYGRDMTGISQKKKEAFGAELAEKVFGFSYGDKATKAAGDELIVEDDSKGGYLVPTEVAEGIMRIAKERGIILNLADLQSMASKDKEIPAYRGNVLTGEFIGPNEEGGETGIEFNMELLEAKKWQVTFVLSNDLLQDSAADLADFIMTLASEAIANRADKEAFQGTGQPFVGLFNDTAVPNFTIDSGNSFSDYDVIQDSLKAISQLETSLLRGSNVGFAMHRTVWAELAGQKSDTGDYILPMAGAVSNGVLQAIKGGGGLTPQGEIHGYPVWNTPHAPSLSESGADTKMLVFGNFSGVAFGRRRENMRMLEVESGTFGGKEISKADQRAMIFKQRWGVATPLPSSFTVAKTNS
jgi:HK97 family phage major capsid protein